MPLRWPNRPRCRVLKPTAARSVFVGTSTAVVQIGNCLRMGVIDPNLAVISVGFLVLGSRSLQPIGVARFVLPVTQEEDLMLMING
jgi:hypothetical protein